MTTALLRKLVRNFPENGPKLLLENPANVRDLLGLVHEPIVDSIDFSGMTVERSHFVQPDYEHVTLDLLLRAPLSIDTNRGPEAVFIYLLYRPVHGRTTLGEIGYAVRPGLAR